MRNDYLDRLIIISAAIGADVSLPNSVAFAQSNNPTFVVTPPNVNLKDDNGVSLSSGKFEIDIPLLKAGELQYVQYGTTAIKVGSLFDTNYGRLVKCLSVLPSSGYGGSSECAALGNNAVQAIYGKSRSKFGYLNGQYVASEKPGETLVDHGNGFCTWTQRDGTQVVYHGYKASGSSICESYNIQKVILPNGNVLDYYYHGSISNSSHNPILSITSVDGYMLKYNYPSTPQRGSQTSVVAINRAFQACDPGQPSCAVSGEWPMATFASQNKTVSVSDNFPPAGPTYNGFLHHIVTLTDQQQRKHIFGTDSYDRVISYQPPGTEAPVFQFTLCSLLADPIVGDVNWPMRDCFGQTNWRLDVPIDDAPAKIGQVQNVTKGAKVWGYGYGAAPTGYYPPFMRWAHISHHPLGGNQEASGNSTPGAEGRMGPMDKVTNRDGSFYLFEASLTNPLISYTKADGAVTTYDYDGRNNLTKITEFSSSDSASTIAREAHYPPICSTLLTCNKPDYEKDANLKQTDYAYESAHGGIKTVTGPAVNGVRPQKRYSYVQRYAWYFNEFGVMTKETRPIWLLDKESYCRAGAPATSGNGCAIAGDEVVTTYDYGPDSGPNNLILRGILVTANGLSQRTCFGHDRNGQKIWERAPKGGMTECPAY